MPVTLQFERVQKKNGGEWGCGLLSHVEAIRGLQDIDKSICAYQGVSE